MLIRWEIFFTPLHLFLLLQFRQTVFSHTWNNNIYLQVLFLKQGNKLRRRCTGTHITSFLSVGKKAVQATHTKKEQKMEKKIDIHYILSSLSKYYMAYSTVLLWYFIFYLIPGTSFVKENFKIFFLNKAILIHPSSWKLKNKPIMEVFKSLSY